MKREREGSMEMMVEERRTRSKKKIIQSVLLHTPRWGVILLLRNLANTSPVSLIWKKNPCMPPHNFGRMTRNSITLHRRSVSLQRSSESQSLSPYKPLGSGGNIEMWHTFFPPAIFGRHVHAQFKKDYVAGAEPGELHECPSEERI